jgi:hypothetical protein
VLLLLAASAFACGGKLAPLPGAADAGEEAEAGDDDAGLVPVIDSVTPDVGPNSGGTMVTITGSGFVVDGGTQVLFAGSPASHVSCDSSHECTLVSPFAGYQTFDQVVDVRATVGGDPGVPPSRTSAKSARDLFTFTAGPTCATSLVCTGIYFPDLHVDCPSTVHFYTDPYTPYQTFVDVASSFVIHTNDTSESVGACYGDPSSSSCSLYSAYEAQWSYCGAGGNYCQLCTSCGGICGMNENGLTCSAKLGGPTGCAGTGGGG